MTGYRIDLKHGYVLTDPAGNITRDVDPMSGRDYQRAPDPSWAIVGFTTRHNGGMLISLEAAAAGVDIGQGWVHDRDHGTGRMWGMPRHRRAVKVTRV